MINHNVGFKLSAITLGILIAHSSAFAASTTLVSGISGKKILGASSNPSLNSDGTKIAFQSNSGIFGNDSANLQHIYLKNTSSNTFSRISVDSNGNNADSISFSPSISGDGKIITYYSYAKNLVSGDTNNSTDVFARDLNTNKTILVSSSATGVYGNGESASPIVSRNGKFVAFDSKATNITTLSTNNKRQVYVKNLSTGEIDIVSINNAGLAGNQDSFLPSISNDGRYVAFASYASNLPSANANKYDIYIHDRQTNTTELVSVGANNHSGQATISGDGRYVAFLTLATTIVSGDTNSTADIIIYDRNNSTFQRVQKSGSIPNGPSFAPKFSEDGRFLAFYSAASNLITNDTNAKVDLFVFDNALNSIERLNLNASGGQTSVNIGNVISISGNGQVAAFSTPESLVGAADENNQNDVYIRHRDTIQNGSPTAKAASIATQECTNGSAYVALNGSTSIDPSSKGLSYSWTGPFGTVTGVTPFVNLGVGTHSITLKVTNDWGNDSTTFNITVADTKNPSISADAAVSKEATSSNGAAHSVGFKASDACELASTHVSPSPAFYPLGTTNITVTATDTVGRTTSDTTSVTVKDTTAPVLSVPENKTVEANAVRSNVNIGNASATDHFLAGISNNAPADYPMNVTNITWTAKDTSNNSTSKVQRITVVDTTKPVLTIPANKSFEATAALSSVSIGSASATDIFPVTVSSNAPTKFPIGTTTVTWTAKDTNNNSISANQLVKLIDSTAPIITAPANVTAEATGIETPVSLGNASTSDTVGVKTIKNDAPSTFPIGNSIVTWTATDTAGNSSYATQTVTVKDTTAPIISTPINVSVEASTKLSVVPFESPSATDVVGVVSLSSNAPTTFPVGTTTITWTAKDAAGNTSTATQTVTVEDTTAPIITAPAAVTAEATAPQTTVNISMATATDMVGIESITSDAPATFPVGVTTVTWTATDKAGNSSTATQVVTVEDTTTPTISAPVNVVTEATAPNSVVTYIAPTADDAVGVTSFTHNAPATFPVGVTAITWTAKDAAGNTTTTTQTITVEDTTTPTISAPINVVTEATAPNSVVSYIAPTADDAVGITSFTHNAPATFPVGVTTITWTAKDAASNTTTATQTITVEDTTTPVISAPVNVDVEATAFRSVVSFLSPTATDIIGVTSFTNNAPASFPVGITTITWTAIDAAGNTTTASQTVKVNDTTPAELTVPANMTIETNGNPSNIADLGTAKAIDIVDGDISANVKITEPVSGYQLGANTVNYSITDKAGNVTKGIQTVTIIDTTAPEFTVSPASLTGIIATSELTEVAIGQAEATDYYLKSVTNDHPSNLFPVGETVVTWSAEDTSGNRSTYKQTVRVSYQFNGYDSPLKNGGVYKSGRVIPVKINLTYADGSPVETAQPMISVFQTSNQEVVGEALDISSVSSADNGTIMRHTNSGNYIYNLNTKLLGKGTFQISVLAHNGSNVEIINIALK